MSKTPEEMRAYRREWAKAYYIRNKERIQAYRQTPKAKALHRKHSVNDRRRYPKRILEKNKEYARKIRQEMLAAYGRKCACCGETHEMFLQLDHINHDGLAHRAAFSGAHIYDLRRRGWPQDNYRLLCANCNFATRYIGEVCPHQAEKQSLAA